MSGEGGMGDVHRGVDRRCGVGDNWESAVREGRSALLPVAPRATRPLRPLQPRESRRDTRCPPIPESHLRPSGRGDGLPDCGDVVLEGGPSAVVVGGGSGRVELGVVRDEETRRQLVCVPDLRAKEGGGGHMDREEQGR
jgi:hypothetical protein